MANTFFQFKQFIIHQDRCAMKVCTDACMFGAYVAEQINNGQYVAGQILDIGTGTGLLSLMLAQKTKATIDAVEIDEATFRQAKENFEKSPWPGQLNSIHSDVLAFYPEKKYDCIITNPPFFEGDLRSVNKKKNTAKHDSSLTLEQMLSVINRNLSPDGFFAVLLPFHRSSYFIEIVINAGYFLNEHLSIQHTKKHPFSRSILFFSHQKIIVAINELVIKNQGGEYTPEFLNLLKHYYL